MFSRVLDLIESVLCKLNLKLSCHCFSWGGPHPPYAAEWSLAYDENYVNCPIPYSTGNISNGDFKCSMSYAHYFTNFNSWNGVKIKSVACEVLGLNGTSNNYPVPSGLSAFVDSYSSGNNTISSEWPNNIGTGASTYRWFNEVTWNKRQNAIIRAPQSVFPLTIDQPAPPASSNPTTATIYLQCTMVYADGAMASYVPSGGGQSWGDQTMSMKVAYRRMAEPIAITVEPSQIDCGKFASTTTRMCGQGFKVLQGNGSNLPHGKLVFTVPASTVTGVSTIANMGDAGWIDLVADGQAVPLDGSSWNGDVTQSTTFTPRIKASGRGNGVESININVTYTVD